MVLGQPVVHTTKARRLNVRFEVKPGYEGIVVSVSMLVVALVVVTLAKWFFR